MSDVTRILSQIDSGDPAAAEQLLPLVYDELRKLAATRLAQERPGQTLQATALVHEAYIRLVGPANQAGFDGRGHFFAAAAEAMRRILVESVRRRSSLKRGCDLARVDLDSSLDVADSESGGDNLLALDEALSELETHDATKARLVKLRFFAGLTIEEAADALDISRATAKRYWVYARAWIYGRIAGE
jgi:RNA polymerase sigma factor (TIGR02999 family)